MSSENYTKNDLAKDIQRDTGYSVSAISEVIGSAITHIQDVLVNRQPVYIGGIGKFDFLDRPAREGRNPRTGEVIMIGSKTAVRFKPCSELKRLMNP